MIVYRICLPEFATDLSGTGAKLYGGRWNSKGVAALYTSVFRSLAALEMTVHQNATLSSKIYTLLEIETGQGILRDLTNHMPSTWKKYPAEPTLQTFGDNNLSKPDSLGFIVKSVQMHEEFNIILNPLHPDFQHLKIQSKREFVFDPRISIKETK